ncbi:hypothetical protein VTJ49DRAFT_3278 [Mycothermus thermophilus]|uniref:CUE domain-containing protein n=1 Tax=Humicola insolens TaxID=85995 RepID=A0ABR3V849_HUMIN
MTTLPSFALFPIAAWRDQVPPDEWVACLNAWLALIASHLSLSESEFATLSAKDESLQAFLVSFTREVASGGANILGSSPSAKRLLRDCYALISKLLQSSAPPPDLARWEFLADASRVYGKKKAGSLLAGLSASSKESLNTSLSALKKFLVKNLDAGLNGGDLKGIEERLERVNDLISVSPPVAEFFLAGSDFIDGLISCYKITNPPLRRVLITTTYLCLVGLAGGQKMSALTDHLYSLKTAADAHKSGPLNVNDSLVAELVTSTPLIQRLQRQLSDSSAPSTRTKSVLTALESFKKPGGSSLSKPKRLIKRKVDKGKGLAVFDAAQEQQEMHVHRMSQISQVQDLFPELGAGFIAKLLNEYADNTETVVAHLLDDSLPPHLQSADWSEPLTHHIPSSSSSQPQARRRSSLLPRPTPPLHSSPGLNPTAPAFSTSLAADIDSDSDELAMLTSSRLHIGKRPGDADSLLRNRSAAPSKAAILSALAAFDSDDDERDDTYDAADVGGAVDVVLTEADRLVMAEGAAAGAVAAMPEDLEAALVRAYLARSETFARDAASRQSADRAKLRDETGLTDEAIEGWAVMLERDEKRKRKLMARYGEFTGEQVEIGRTAWRAGVDEDEDEDGGEGGEGSSDTARGGGGFGRGRGGRGGGGPGRGRGRGRGGSAPPADSDLARRRKEANKGSRANHNRRDGRARKMARAGFAG